MNLLAKKTPIHRLLISTGVLTLSLCLSACDDSASSAQEYTKNLKRGETYLEQGQYKAAIIEAKNALQKAPNEVSSHLLMANILLKMDQSKDALEQLALIDASDNPEYLFTKAEAFNAQRKYRSAEQLLVAQQALLTQSDETRYLELSADALVGQGKLDEGTAVLQQLLQLSPENADTLVNLALISFQGENKQQGDEYLQQAFAVSPENIKALLLKAQIDKINGDLSSAEDALTIALTSLDTTDIMTPLRARILNFLADILTQQGRSTEALIYTRILNDALPGQMELSNQFEKALALLKEGKVDQAETLLEEIITKAPNHQTASQILGIIKYNRGDFQAAESYFADNIDAETAPESATLAFAMTNMRLNHPQKVLDLLDEQIEDTDNVQLLGLYGLASLSANQISKGEMALKKALSIEPQRSRLRLALANAYNAEQQPEKALDQLTAAYQSTPEDPFIQRALLQQYQRLNLSKESDTFVKTLSKEHADNVGSLILVGIYQYYAGNDDAAIASLKKALDLAPSNAEAMNGLGIIYLRNKNYQQATAHYRKIIDITPELTTGYKGLITSLELQNKQAEAIKEITSLATKTEHPAPYSVLVEFFARNGDYAKAGKFLLTAQQKFPQDTSIQQLGIQLALTEGREAFKFQQLAKTRQIVMKGLKIDPENVSLQTLLIDTEIAEKNYLEASKLTEQLAVNNGNLAMFLRGNIATAQEKYNIALNHYQALWQNQPSDNVAQRIYSNLSQQNKTAELKAFLQQWEQTFPQSIPMLTIRSANAISNKHYDMAIQDLEKALEQQKNSPSPLLLNNLAWAYLQSGKMVDAEQNAKRAYTAAPANAAIADTYGWVLLKAGKSSEARKILKVAYELAPDNAEIAEHWKLANQ